VKIAENFAKKINKGIFFQISNFVVKLFLKKQFSNLGKNGKKTRIFGVGL